MTFAHRSPRSGTGVYLACLVEALQRAAGVDVIEAVNHGRRPPGGGGIRSARNFLTDQRWASIELPRLVAAHEADVVHHPLPAYSPRTGIPQLITVHDLAFERLPGCFDRRFRTYAHVAHRAAARAAAAIICVSETTAEDVRERWKVSADRIVVAPHGPGQRLPDASSGRSRVTHFLYVGDAEPRKDVGTLVEGYRRYRTVATNPLPLILAGSVEVTAPGLISESHPGPARLAELYAGAAALIQPSLYEGFGFTALEAMNAGTPVIASAAPGLLETCGDAVRYFAPRDPEALATALAQLATDPGLRAELGERGLRRAADFSWDSCARAHVAAYSVALSNR